MSTTYSSPLRLRLLNALAAHDWAAANAAVHAFKGVLNGSSSWRTQLTLAALGPAGPGASDQVQGWDWLAAHGFVFPTVCHPTCSEIGFVKVMETVLMHQPLSVVDWWYQKAGAPLLPDALQVTALTRPDAEGLNWWQNKGAAWREPAQGSSQKPWIMLAIQLHGLDAERHVRFFVEQRLKPRHYMTPSRCLNESMIQQLPTSTPLVELATQMRTEFNLKNLNISVLSTEEIIDRFSRLWDLLVELGDDPKQEVANGNTALTLLEGTPLAHWFRASKRAKSLNERGIALGAVRPRFRS